MGIRNVRGFLTKNSDTVAILSFPELPARPPALVFRAFSKKEISALFLLIFGI
jgi:hypothetical protein